MALRQITPSDVAGTKISELPDRPGLGYPEMNQRFDAYTDKVVEIYNENFANIYDKAETQAQIDAKVVAIGTGDMAQAIYDPNHHETDIFAYAMPASVYDPNGHETDIFDYAMPKDGGAFTGQVMAGGDQEEETAQIRNIVVLPSETIDFTDVPNSTIILVKK